MKKKEPKRKRKPKITPHLDTFAGIKLEPMTKQREVVAAEMGMKWGFVVTYRPQFYLRDTIIVVWLRAIQVETSTASGWCVDRAEVEPDEAMKEAFKWATKMNIGINSLRFDEAWRIFVDTMRQIREAKGEPIIENKTDSEAPLDSGEL